MNQLPETLRRLAQASTEATAAFKRRGIAGLRQYALISNDKPARDWRASERCLAAQAPYQWRPGRLLTQMALLKA